MLSMPKKKSEYKGKSIKLSATAHCLQSTLKDYHKDMYTWFLLKHSPAQ